MTQVEIVKRKKIKLFITFLILFFLSSIMGYLAVKGGIVLGIVLLILEIMAILGFIRNM